MYKVDVHPILDIPKGKEVEFRFDGKTIKGEAGLTIATALHRAGYPVHSHSLENRERSLECGIGKCGACEMLVDGVAKRICITLVDGVKEVQEIPQDYIPSSKKPEAQKEEKIFRTTVAIIGAGPAGLAARELLLKNNIPNLVVDNNSKIGGQFNMQTHQFFFFEKEKKFGGMRGFDIAKTLASDSMDGILLDSTVWDILDGKRIAVKNIVTNEIYYIDADYLVVATGAVPFMPAFENDDLPGVYTAAVVQKMMNQEYTILGKNILTVGAGNIGYLTSYQLMQAGANVKAIIEAAPHEGGFPVQANRVRRLGIPIMLSHMLIKAVPNKNHDGIVGAIVAQSENFQPIPGTERYIDGIDAINICTGLFPDNHLLIKGNEVFGKSCYGAGDAIRIGEGTSAVLRGQQVAYEIMQELGHRVSYSHYLAVSKEYIESQQHPVHLLKEAQKPSGERLEKPFVIADCLYGFACNPCSFACQYGAIIKNSTNSTPVIDYTKCIGCMQCVTLCPGLAIFGYNIGKQQIFLPVEFHTQEGTEVYLVDNNGKKMGEGVIEKVITKPNKTNLARVKCTSTTTDDLTNIRGFIAKDRYPEPVTLKDAPKDVESELYLCHCDDVPLDEVLAVIGNRKFISADEIKHTTHLGMGPCRGKRCMKRLKVALAPMGIEIVGDSTPRGPLSNQITMGELKPNGKQERYITEINSKPAQKVKVTALIAGGGIAGSSLFMHMAKAGLEPTLLNFGRGSSWRNIAGGRPAFSLPEIAEIATRSNEQFKQLQDISNIDYRPINYVNFAHDDKTYQALEASKAWSNAYMVDPKDFDKEISPFINPKLDLYKGALITRDCWQATPGKTVDLIRDLGVEHGGTVEEDSELISIHREGKEYVALVRNHKKEFIEYHTELFINALGGDADRYAKQLGYQLGMYPVKHQAFITRRLPWLGANTTPLGMLIDRRKYKGFVAVYGQQLADTGQIIGCASPMTDPQEAGKNLAINSQEFLKIVSEVFTEWIPNLSNIGFQAFWAGYYTEPRMYVDPEAGLLVGLRGQGFMLGLEMAKLYVDKITGKPTPAYFDRLSIQGDGLLEQAFK